MKRTWRACFEVLVLVLVANQCGACGLLDSGGSAWPGKDKWGVSRDGTNKATRSTWAGTLEWATVYDQHGVAYRVAVLTNVSGLNPRDSVDRWGAGGTGSFHAAGVLSD